MARVAMQNKLREYYRVQTNVALLYAMFHDALVSTFTFSGSGLLTSIAKGLIMPFFMHIKRPVLLGKRLRIKNGMHISMGKNCVIKHDVSLIADGPMKIGDGCIIAEGTILSSYGDGLTIGNQVTIGNNCYIAQHGGPITIGENVLIGDGVRMYSLNHTYATQELIQKQPCIDTSIVIEPNVWIGSGVVIFNNVTIGSGSVVGANTVVRKSIPKGMLVAGNPGEIIRKIR